MNSDVRALFAYRSNNDGLVTDTIQPGHHAPRAARKLHELDQPSAKEELVKYWFECYLAVTEQNHLDEVCKFLRAWNSVS